jgi:two-component system response regulator HydG
VVKGVAPEAKMFMTRYHWPGNVRELRNVIERAMILTDQEYITQEQLPFELRNNEGHELSHPSQDLIELTDDMSLEHIEKIHISRVLRKLEWNKSKTAKMLGVSRATLREKIKRYEISNN